MAVPGDSGDSAICFPGVLGAQALVRIQGKEASEAHPGGAGMAARAWRHPPTYVVFLELKYL